MGRGKKCSIKGYCPEEKCNKWSRNYCSDDCCDDGCGKYRRGHCGKCRRDPCCCDPCDNYYDDCCNDCGYNDCRCRRKCGSCRSYPCCCDDDCCNDCGYNDCRCRKSRRRKRRGKCCNRCSDRCGYNPCCDDCCYDDCCYKPKKCCMPTCIDLCTEPINGALMVPPVAGNVKGSGCFILDNRKKELHYEIEICNLTGAPTAAGFYNAAAGATGPLVKTLNAPQACYGNRYKYRGKWKSTDAEPLTDDLIMALLKWEIYVRIDTNANPTGEARGQIMPQYAESKVHSPCCY